MLTSLTTPPVLEESPAAVRAATPGWRDPRLWIGVALVAVSVVVGARVVGGADETVPMWVAGADLAPGDTVDPSDLVVSRVRFADPAAARHYFAAADALPAERHLQRGVGAGELLPRAVLGPADTDVPHVAVSVPSSQVPPAVAAGSVVDVWVLPHGGAGDGTKARLAVPDVVVVEAPRGAADFGGVSPDRQLVLGIPDEEDNLARVVTASGDGRLMLVGRG